MQDFKALQEDFDLFYAQLGEDHFNAHLEASDGMPEIYYQAYGALYQLAENAAAAIPQGVSL